jgi:hypothetical protein
VVAPGVRAVRRVAITARGRGQIALAYLGSADRSSFDGYITASADALARRAVFWSAAVSGPGAPLVTGSDDETYGNRLFYGTAAIAADGTVWAGFHCARTPSCPGRRLGIVGRLRPHSTRHRPRPHRQERP